MDGLHRNIRHKMVLYQGIELIPQPITRKTVKYEKLLDDRKRCTPCLDQIAGPDSKKKKDK